MLYTVKLQKGEVWHPEDLKQVAVRIAKGNAWVTFRHSNEDLIYRSGEKVDLQKDDAVIEALSEELDLEIEFKKRASLFFSRK